MFPDGSVQGSALLRFTADQRDPGIPDADELQVTVISAVKSGAVPVAPPFLWRCRHGRQRLSER